MQFFDKANKHGWFSLVFGVGLFVSAGLVYAASPEKLVQDAFGNRVLAWERLSRINFPLLTDKPRKTAKLSLEDCIRRTLAHNLDIRISSHDPAIRMADVVQAEAAFDAVLFSSANFGTTDQANPDSGFFTRTIQTNNGSRNKKIPSDPFDQLHDYNYSLGLRKRMPTGATIELAQRARRLRMEEQGLYRNPFYQTSLDLELRQPLLRDFGIDINRATIHASRNNFAISQQQFHLQVIQAVVTVEGNYWQLVFTRQRVRILEELVRQSEITLQRLENRVNLDAGAGIIARNRGLIEKARGDLVTARNDVLIQQDRLLESINDPNLSLRQLWEIIPIDEPTMQPFPVDRQQAFQIALQTRPELISQELTIDTAALAVGVAQNQLLPRLDLLARQEVTAPGGSTGTAWQNQHDYDTVNYLAGLSFEVPIGNRAPRAELRKAKLQERQEKLRLDSFKEQVLLDVSNSLLSLQSAYDETSARLAAAEAEAGELSAYLALEDAAAKIDIGFLDRKLFAQERLAQYQSILAQAILKYNIAIADIQRAQGTLLQYNNINLAELTEKNK
jgi:outer membrane protein